MLQLSPKEMARAGVRVANRLLFLQEPKVTLSSVGKLQAEAQPPACFLLLHPEKNKIGSLVPPRPSALFPLSISQKAPLMLRYLLHLQAEPPALIVSDTQAAHASHICVLAQLPPACLLLPLLPLPTQTIVLLRQDGRLLFPATYPHLQTYCYINP